VSRLNQARAQFERRLREAEDFVKRCQGARHASRNRPALIAGQIEWAHEAAAVKLAVASEQFLEITLGLYTLGHRTTSGYRPRRVRTVVLSLPSMLEVFRGDQAFIGWSDPSTVIARSARWLRRGEPYLTTLSSASQLLSYLKKMRNVIVHESDDAVERYERATRALYGALPRRIAPGAQLAGPPPTGMPFLVGASLFEACLGVYRTIAQGVVP